MTDRRVSPHLLAVYDFVRSRQGWASSGDIATGAGVAPRTARAHARLLSEQGVFDVAQSFPGNRYRLASAHNDFARQLEAARDVLGE
jgi:hypothetical protein